MERSVEAALTNIRKLKVCWTGRYRGTADVEAADIAGNVEGSVIAREILTVRATAVSRETSRMLP